MRRARATPVPALAGLRPLPSGSLMRCRALLAGGLAVLAGTAWPATAPAAGPTGRDDRHEVVFRLADERITEASGLAVSRRHEGVVYTHNDSDDAPRIYAIGVDGKTLATLTLARAEARDWEDIAVGEDAAGRPALFVGDIGDNLGGAWRTISVYRFTEPPRLASGPVPATRYRFRYADGARDAEALLVDPRTNRLYVVSKQFDAGLYVAPRKLDPGGVNVLRRVGRAPSFVTGGAFAPDGKRFVLRTYGTAYVFNERRQRVATITLPVQEQGESITYTPDGDALLSGSEGLHSGVVQVPVGPVPGTSPASAARSPSPRAPAAEQPQRE
ncbi:MAG: WD40 repeat domain-containing protein, partial [Streptomycetales bacterium]